MRGAAAWAPAACALAACLVYAATLRNGFVWDDHLYVTGAAFVREPRNLALLLSPSFYLQHGPVEGGARPLFLATLLADRALWGESPAGYHLTNILLHAGCAALLAALAAAWTGTAAAGLLAGLILAVHPAASEAVCGVSFRPDLLAAIFVLLALLADLRARQTRARGGALAWTATGALAAGLALLSKENAAAAALLLPLSWLGIPAPFFERVRRVLALALLAAVLALYAGFRLPRGGYESVGGAAEHTGSLAPATATAHHAPSPPEWAWSQREAGARLLVAASGLALYARLLAAPWPLIADRPPPEPDAAAAVTGLLFLTALLLAAWAARRRLPAASVGLLWFLAALAPASGIVPLHNPVAERYLYLPLAGIALAAAATLEAAARRLRPGRPGTALAALACMPLAVGAILASRRAADWRSDAALFAGEGSHSRGLYNRALQAQAAGRLEEAAAVYRRAAAANPAAAEPRVNLAALEQSAGRSERALALLREAAAAAPGSALTQEALGAALERAGRREEALAAYARGAALDPRLASLRLRYAVALLAHGHARHARAQAAEAARLQPSAAAWYAAGRASLAQRRYADAAEDFQRALALDPAHAGAAGNLGVALHRAGRVKEARAAFEDACRLSPDSAELRYGLGSLLDAIGELSGAERELEEAVRLDSRYADAWHALAVVRQKHGRDRDAEAAYRRSAELAPWRVESASNLAGLLTSRGDPEQALAVLEPALRREPSRPALLHNRGAALLRLNRVEEAAAVFDAALSASAAVGDAPPLRAPTLEALARCRLLQDRPADALRLAREALAADPSYAPALALERLASKAL